MAEVMGAGQFTISVSVPIIFPCVSVPSSHKDTSPCTQEPPQTEGPDRLTILK